MIYASLVEMKQKQCIQLNMSLTAATTTAATATTRSLAQTRKLT